MHIPVTRVYHRHFPEVRGEGHSLDEATGQLVRLLNRSVERTHGTAREAMERVVAEVRAGRPANAQVSRPQVAATS
jgi:hypothetical protein